MNTDFSPARIVSLALAVVGAVVGFVALFLDYWHYNAGGYGYKMIDHTQFVSFVYGNSFILEAAAIVGIAIASLFWRSVILWAMATAFAAALFMAWLGYLLAPGINDGYFGNAATDWGCYLGSGGALLALAGSLLGLRDAFFARVAEGIAGAAASPPTPHAVPPSGWFPDPAGGAGQRWWNGQAWTSDTHPGVPA